MSAIWMLFAFFILTAICKLNAQCTTANGCICHCNYCSNQQCGGGCKQGWSGDQYYLCQRIRNKEYEFYVTDQSAQIDTNTLCINDKYRFSGGKKTWNIECSKELPGTIVVIFAEKSTFLQVYEIQVQECAHGTYGKSCENLCDSCDNGCDQKDGKCKCQPGRYGPLCDSSCQMCDSLGCRKNEGTCFRCVDGYFGHDCYTPCSANCKTRRCQRETGACACKTGYSGSHCIQCGVGTYGDNCSQNCSTSCKANRCHHISGNCVYGCKSGRYGEKCEKACSAGCSSEVCDKLYGQCVSCKTGYVGSYCDVCPKGKYGEGCQFSCFHCKNNECNHVTGVCDSCKDGYTGRTCNATCPIGCKETNCHEDGKCFSCKEGLKGPSCDMQCQVNCASCEMKEDRCTSCEVGWRGDLCKTECPTSCGNNSCSQHHERCDSCPVGKHGNICEHTCNKNCIDSICKKSDGVCIKGCSNKKHGVNCDTKCRANCLHCYDGNNCSLCVSGYFGRYCTGNCPNNCYNCSSHNLCDVCNEGYFGQSCAGKCLPTCKICVNKTFCLSCVEDRIGQMCDCNSKCKDNCGKSGNCYTGCKMGYFGESCNKNCSRGCISCEQTTGNCTECQNGNYGPLCAEECSMFCLNQKCNIKTGFCLEGCKDGFSGETCAFRQTQANDSSFPLYIVAVVGVCVILLIILVMALIFRRRVKAQKEKAVAVMTSEVEVELADNKPHDTGPVYANRCFDETKEYENTCDVKKRCYYDDKSPYNLRGSQAFLIELGPDDVEEMDIDINVDSDYYNVQINRIPVDQLWEHVQEKKAKDAYKDEFDNIPNGLLDRCEEALKPKNRSRNRYKKMYPYDHSRVVLEIEKGTDNSGFINACFVNGFENDREYIASQGPFTQETTYDFWRMIWQQNCGKIVMLTNIMENNIMKCKKYWPETEEDFGQIHVKMTKEVVYANYTIREMAITKDNQTKSVLQYHFTVWPDKGVPRNVTSIVDFRNKVASRESVQSGPLLIHCSAGVGRTGTFMALDYLLKQGERTGDVDVISCVSRMRQQRVNVVQTVEQYIFLYDALVEGLSEGKCVITTADFGIYYKHLKEINTETNKSYLFEQFQKINRLASAVDESSFKAANKPENKKKNRYPNILASDNYRIFISGKDNDYINAIQLPGYQNRHAFALTQMPMTNTVEDFWSLVFEQDVSSIVMMNAFKRGKEIGNYWPIGDSMAEYGSVAVSILEKQTGNAPFDVLKLKAYNQKTNEERTLKQFQCKFWAEDALTPSTPEPLINIIKAVTEWQRDVRNPTIVVHCMNGAKKSGLFCAVASIIERLQAEQEVDVVQTVLQMRARRAEIVSSKEQLQFCYETVASYLEMFNTYSNLE